ncbi:MAG: GNAT family N-acetyltransferase [Thermoplasmatota archaeon]|nr:GNAT family N-acetyltransferase [Halobacteriales archaeon]
MPLPPWFTEMELREVTLGGNHVILEPLRVEHANELWPDAVEPGLFQHLAPGLESSKADLRAWIQRRLDEQAAGSALPFLQRDSVTGKAFGCTAMFNASARHHRLEIGHTWLGKSHRKTPANTEAKLLLLTHAFEKMEAIRVQFKVDVRNEAAVAALERIGAVREGLMRNERILLDGFIRDAYVFSIVGEEWPAVKARLNELLWIRPKAEPLAKPEPPRVPGLNPTVTPPVGAHSAAGVEFIRERPKRPLARAP